MKGLGMVMLFYASIIYITHAKNNAYECDDQSKEKDRTEAGCWDVRANEPCYSPWHGDAYFSLIWNFTAPYDVDKIECKVEAIGLSLYNGYNEDDDYHLRTEKPSCQIKELSEDDYFAEGYFDGDVTPMKKGANMFLLCFCDSNYYWKKDSIGNQTLQLFVNDEEFDCAFAPVKFE